MVNAADPCSASFTASFKTATGGFNPYAWQLEVAVGGLPDVLAVPTGLEKTEIALAWAWRLLIDKKPAPLTTREGDDLFGVRTYPDTLVIGIHQWPLKFSIATLPNHGRDLHEHRPT